MLPEVSAVPAVPALVLVFAPAWSELLVVVLVFPVALGFDELEPAVAPLWSEVAVPEEVVVLLVWPVPVVPVVV